MRAAGAARSDVLVESFRPGVLARRGLGAADLMAANPRLVYCSVTGLRRPLDPRAGHDINYAALRGFLGGNRDAGRRAGAAARARSPTWRAR